MGPVPLLAPPRLSHTRSPMHIQRLDLCDLALPRRHLALLLLCAAHDALDAPCPPRIPTTRASTSCCECSIIDDVRVPRLTGIAQAWVTAREYAPHGVRTSRNSSFALLPTRCRSHTRSRARAVGTPIYRFRWKNGTTREALVHRQFLHPH